MNKNIFVERTVLYFRANQGRFAQFPCLLAEEVRIPVLLGKRQEFLTVTERAIEIEARFNEYDLEFVGYGVPGGERWWLSPVLPRIVCEVFGVQIESAESDEWVKPLALLKPAAPKLNPAIIPAIIPIVPSYDQAIYS